jgi:pilus assembly protein CpaF
MEGEVITMQEIFRFEQQGMDTEDNIRGEIVATGIRPSFVDELSRNGIDLPPDLFKVPVKSHSSGRKV